MVKTITPITLVASLCLVSTNTLAYEPYISIGINTHSGNYETQVLEIDNNDHTGTGYHLSAGVHRSFGQTQKHWIGTGIDIDHMLDDRITGFRAIDYRYQLFPKIRTGAFIGAVSLDSGLPQNGYYYGLNSSWQEVFARVDLGLEIRYADGLARDRLLASDPRPETEARPDTFVNILSATFSLSWRF